MQIPQLPQIATPDLSNIGGFDLNAATINMAEQIGNLTIAKLQGAIAVMFQNWLADHPIFAWAFIHPLKAAILLLAILLVVQGLLGAIQSKLQNLWLSLLSFPYQLLRWLAVGVFNLVRHGAGNARSSELKGDEAIAQTRVTEILSELSTMQRQQERLMKEVEEILSTYDLPTIKKGWLSAE